MDQSSDDRNMLHQVQQYRKLVLLYEAIDEEIDQLIMTHNGATENMSDADLDQYRHLARQRDEILNEMRGLEQELLLSEDDDVWKRAQPPISKGKQQSDYRPDV